MYLLLRGTAPGSNARQSQMQESGLQDWHCKRGAWGVIETFFLKDFEEGSEGGKRGDITHIVPSSR